MSWGYLHVGQHSFACALGPMAWLELLEAMVIALPSLQHLNGGIEQLRGIYHHLALQRVWCKLQGVVVFCP